MKEQIQQEAIEVLANVIVLSFFNSFWLYISSLLPCFPPAQKFITDEKEVAIFSLLVLGLSRIWKKLLTKAKLHIGFTGQLWTFFYSPIQSSKKSGNNLDISILFHILKYNFAKLNC